MSLPAPQPQEARAREPHQKFKGHTSFVWGAIHLPGKQRVITCSADGSLRLWSLKNGLQIGKEWRDGGSPVFSIALCPDGKTVLSGSGDGAIRSWDVDTGKATAKWTGHSGGVWSICWSRDYQRVVSGSADGTARMWDVKSGETILGPINTEQEVVYAVAYSPDETKIATGGCRSGGGEGMIKIWDTKTFTQVTTLKRQTNNVWCLAWTTDKTIISQSVNHTIRIWNTTTWKQIAVFKEHSKNIDAITISPNHRILASASRDNTVQLWDLENHLPISSMQHTNPAYCMSFSSDGELLATGHEGGDIFTWDISAIVKEAGFDHLLSDSDVLMSQKEAAELSIVACLQDPARKPILDADATWPLATPINNPRQLPQGFFDAKEDHIHSSSTRQLLYSTASQTLVSHPQALLDRLSLPFRWFRPGVRIAPLHDGKRRPPVVEVPCTQGQPRNVKAKRQHNTMTSVPNIMTLNILGTSRSPISDGSQQSGVPVHDRQQSLLPQASSTVTHAHGATTTSMSTTETPSPSVLVIRQPGYWSRFWIFLCCVPTEKEDGPS